MLTRHRIRLAIAALVLGLGAASAPAQFVFQPFGFSPFTPFTPFYPTYSFGSPYSPGFGGFPSYGYPGYGGYGGYPYYYSDMSYTTTYTVPGWAVSGNDLTTSAPLSARWRPTLFPALAVPADSTLLQVAYEPVTRLNNSEYRLVGYAPEDTRAMVIVTLPSSQARVWVEGMLTSQQGMVRRFRTPALSTGRNYTYDIVAQWTDSQGQTRTVNRTVTMRAGEEVAVDMTR